MKLFIYAFMFAVALIVFKAFYLDSLPAESDINASTEQNATVQEVVTAPVATVAPKSSDKDTNRTGWRDRKGMPIDQLGDSIAEKLKKEM